MRKNGIPEVLVRSVRNLYEGANMRVMMNSEMSEEFEFERSWDAPWICSVIFSLYSGGRWSD